MQSNQGGEAPVEVIDADLESRLAEGIGFGLAALRIAQRGSFRDLQFRSRLLS